MLDFKKINLQKWFVILLSILAIIAICSHYMTTLFLFTESGVVNYRQNADISVEFRYDSLREDFENIFQTAAENNGLRFELTTMGMNGNSGLVFMQNNKLDFINIGALPLPKIWHTLEAKIIDNTLAVYLDGALVGEKKIDSSQVLFNDVAFGTGFSRERNFNGEVKNFNVRLYKHTNIADKLPFIILVFCDLCLAYYLFKSMKFSTIKSTGGGQLFLTVISLGMIYRGTRMYIASQDQYLCYAALLGGYLLAYWLWRNLKLGDYGYASLLAGLFILLKCFIIRLSFVGSMVDFFSILFVVAVFKLILQKVPCRSVVLCAICAGGGMLFDFLSIAAMYVHKIGNPGMPFGEEIQAIMQTNPQEVCEFVQTLLLPEEIIAGFCCFFVYFILIFLAVRKYKEVNISKLWQRMLLGIIIFALVQQNYVLGISQSVAAPLAVVMNYYNKSMEQMKYYQSLRAENENLYASSTRKGETYVIVIGESANKLHMSSYGYFRKTTPWLDLQRNNENALFLENAYASYVHTVPALLNALTSANQYNKKNNFVAPSIIEIAKAAGFHTYWFSNQNSYGLIDNPLTIIADEADEAYWTPTSNRGPDGELIKLLDKKLQNIDSTKNNLIVVHLIGSHEQYIKRLPKGYDTQWQESGMEYFGDIAKDEDFMKNEVDVYDATIKYSDENLEKIYDLISGRVNDLSAFVYFSDHGQDVFGRLNHNAALFNFEMDRVPMVTIVSDKWKMEHNDIFAQIKNHSEMPYTTDLFYDYFIGLSGIKTDEYEVDKDITSNEYSLNWDNAMVLWTDKNLQTQFYSKTQPQKISEDPLYISRKNMFALNNEKPKSYLAVACDSIGAVYDAVNEGFCGIEVNITPTSDTIMIGHYPECVLDMTFEKYLQSIPYSKIETIWLDMKFSSPELVEKTFERFELLDKIYGLKNKVILESSLVGDDMKIFSDAGWNTMYYFLPTRNALSNDISCPEAVFNLVANKSGKEYFYMPTAEEKADIERYSHVVADVIKRQHAKNVSFWMECYPYINSEVAPLLSENINFMTFAMPQFPSISDKLFLQKFQQYKYKNILDNVKLKNILIVPTTAFGIDLNKM